RARRAGDPLARLPRLPRAPSRHACAPRDRPRRDGPRPRAGDERGDRPRAEGGRLPLRQPRPAGLPHRQPERRAAAASGLKPAASSAPDPRHRPARAIALSASALAVVFLAFHLRYLPASLEDLDSINFALGMRRFDVAHHQPHPPGYPVYIAAAKTAASLSAG